jgi:hypothetical protein
MFSVTLCLSVTYIIGSALSSDACHDNDTYHGNFCDRLQTFIKENLKPAEF